MNEGQPFPQNDERGPVPAALKRFIWDIQSMVELAESEREILMIGGDLMRRLLSSEDWLPPAFSTPSPAEGRQFQIYSDGMERFCVVSTVLPGGAALLIAQPAVWEIAGVLSGSVVRSDGRLLSPGAVETLRSSGENAVRLSNAAGDQASIVIHVYGGEIGNMTRRLIASEKTADDQLLAFANGANAPPYDIYSIQTDIRD